MPAMIHEVKAAKKGESKAKNLHEIIDVSVIKKSWFTIINHSQKDLTNTLIYLRYMKPSMKMSVGERQTINQTLKTNMMP
jgi:hypothetical protein